MSEEREDRASLHSVAKRFEASRREEQDPAERQAKDAGKRWAEFAAKHSEIVRLEAWAEAFTTTRPDGWTWYFSEAGSRDRSASCAEEVAWGMCPAPVNTPEIAKAFWEKVAGADQSDETAANRQYVRYFAEGALQVWRAVKGRMEPQ